MGLDAALIKGVDVANAGVAEEARLATVVGVGKPAVAVCTVVKEGDAALVAVAIGLSDVVELGAAPLLAKLVCEAAATVGEANAEVAPLMEAAATVEVAYAEATPLMEAAATVGDAIAEAALLNEAAATVWDAPAEAAPLEDPAADALTAPAEGLALALLLKSSLAEVSAVDERLCVLVAALERSGETETNPLADTATLALGAPTVAL